MSRTVATLLALMLLPTVVAAQTDTTRRRDTTRVQPTDSTRRVRTESGGETDLARPATRFRDDLPNYGFSTEQATELQEALTRAGCDVGVADGAVGQRTLRGIECFRSQRSIETADLETVLTALELSFARPAEPVPAPVTPPAPPPRRDTTVLPPVLRPDTTYRAELRARRDSALRRDSLGRDSLARDSLGRDSTRRDTTVRRDTSARRDTTTRPD